ncbi:MAG: condensation domain-containing protein, partial [Pseudomonadota bacterium]
MGNLTIKERILDLVDKGVSLDVVDHKLVVRGPLDQLDSGERSFLVENKHAIIRVIADTRSAEGSRIQPRDPSVRVPLSFAQKQLWLIDKLNPGRSHYCVPIALKLQGNLNEDALQTAFDELLRRHEILRTVFVSGVDGEVEQFVQEPTALPIDRVDLTAFSGRELHEKIEECLQSDALATFKLEKDLMIRALLMRLDESTHIVFCNIHHIAADGWSMGVLTRDFSQYYMAAVTSSTPELAPLGIQYADYACWQHAHIERGGLEAPLNYWRNGLANLPSLHSLRSHQVRPAIADYDGARHYQTFCVER